MEEAEQVVADLNSQRAGGLLQVGAWRMCSRVLVGQVYDWCVALDGYEVGRAVICWWEVGARTLQLLPL